MAVLEGSLVDFEVLNVLAVTVEARLGPFCGPLGHHRVILESSCFPGRAHLPERCDCNLSRPVECLFSELRLKAFGEHKGAGDRSEDFSTWVALHDERP